MKLFIAHGESRNFEFTAYGDTEAKAKVNLYKAFLIHAKQYDLPLDWHKTNADFWITEVDTNKVYRDRSEMRVAA
jgi:hypothetical protein